jgi:hypothetical protein
MPKTAVGDWSTTAGSNTDINSINIDEGWASASINNAFREMMAQIATWYAGITAGGTITGSNAGSDSILTFDSADDAAIILDKAASGDTAYIQSKKAGVLRWSMELGNATVESGSEATGSNFTLTGYSDAGASLGAYITVNRQSGAATITTVSTNVANVTALSGYGKGTGNGLAGFGDTTTAGAGGGVIGWSTDGTTFGRLGYYDTANHFSVYGNANAYLTAGTWGTASDLRLKTDLNRIDGALDRVEALTGYTFTRIDSGARETGLVAQDVERVLPEAVVQGTDGMLGLSYGNLAGLLVEAIKELRAEVSELRARLEGEP